jgi:hypothetical protein
VCLCRHHSRPDRLAQDSGLARVGPQQSGNHGNDGGLAGAVGAKQTVGFARLDTKRHVVDGGEVSEATDQTIRHQHGIGHFEPPLLVSMGVLRSKESGSKPDVRV